MERIGLDTEEKREEAAEVRVRPVQGTRREEVWREGCAVAEDVGWGGGQSAGLVAPERDLFTAAFLPVPLFFCANLYTRRSTAGRDVGSRAVQPTTAVVEKAAAS